MSIEDRSLKPGTILVARYKKQDFRCTVAEGEDGIDPRWLEVPGVEVGRSAAEHGPCDDAVDSLVASGAVVEQHGTEPGGRAQACAQQ